MKDLNKSEKLARTLKRINVKTFNKAFEEFLIGLEKRLVKRAFGAIFQSVAHEQCANTKTATYRSLFLALPVSDPYKSLIHVRQRVAI